MGVFSKEISAKHLAVLCRQLATSYDAGIPIVRSLDMARLHARDKQARTVLEGMSSAVMQGASLGEAANSQQPHLPQFLVELFRSGEQGGKLDVMLRDLADFYEDRVQMQRAVLLALVYPVLQLLAAWFLGTFALGLLSSLDLSGRTVFSLSGYLSKYAFFQVQAIFLAFLFMGFAVFLSRMGVLKWIVGWVTNTLWPLKKITHKFALSRFFRSLSLLIGSGMPIIRCIEQSAAATANPYIQRDLLQSVPLVKDGCTLVQAFSSSRTFTPMAREMLMVGEQSGKLEEALRKVSEYHLDEANAAVKAALVVLGILILIIVGAVVGGVVITFWSRFYGGMLDSIGV